MPGARSEGGRLPRPLLLGVLIATLASGTVVRGAPSEPCPSWDANGDGTTVLAILGDSNSFALVRWAWSTALANALREAQPGRWDVRQYAQMGARITANASNPRLGGAFQVDRALATTPPVDVALLAFGTNDHLHGVAPEAVVEAYGAAIARLEAVGAFVLLATTPPCWTAKCDRKKIAGMNALMRRAWPQRTMVDFSSWVGRDDLGSKGLHFLPAGHEKRRDAASKVLLGCRPAH